MLLYLQPERCADQRRCFLLGSPGVGLHDLVELATDTATLDSGAGDDTGPVCVHTTPPVTMVYLALE